jgi:nitrogen fixation NifU-like protein
MATLYSDILLDHFRNPRNYGSVPSPDVSFEDVNPLCGDRIRIELCVRGGIVEAARFKGDGCAISLAAASILTELIQGADVTRGVPVSTDQLLSSLRSDIKPARIKCALLPLEALRSGIRIYNQGNSSLSPESHQDD